ncbi:transmembrane protein 208 [Lingula anatina]|uniref:Transmembrane protein 208 n=1 Tax=Lingula anatina TaxID=7574 RepID=A0A1S3I307_LINAN|nr:transmembrane protein 208 [Lingula anatina]|eukprot:XP_013392652.1 transmembrane protein 208 [Lingula anatina]
MPPKGKQGTKGQKQIDEENKATLKFYGYIILGVSAVYMLLTFLLFWDSFTTMYWVLTILTLIVYGGSYQFMSSMMKSSLDLNMEQGMAEHIKDLILLTAITQSLSLISNYFWLLWLLAPGRALYMLWVNILGPWIFAEAPEEPDEKKTKKMERKMKRMH